jgi:ketosteroid isomerase-like protein
VVTEPDASARIAQAGQRFLQRFAGGDPAGIAACYTEDAQILAANMSPVRGRVAIESVCKFTRYIVIWKRVGADWKMHRDMFTSGRKG